MNNDSSFSKKYYSTERVAEEYDAERFTTVAGKMFDKFEKNVVISNLPFDSKNIKILDAGAGSGRFTLEMAKMGLHVTACDYSPTMINVIKSKISKLDLNRNVNLSRQDITHLTFENDIFDFICCMRVTVNLDTKDNLIKGIKELVRVCKPGGRLVFDIVNPKSIAILGPKKSSMISLGEAKEILRSIPGIRLKNCFGRRILSQTAFEKSPALLLDLVDLLDRYLSDFFPMACVRIYFVVEKN